MILADATPNPQSFLQFWLSVSLLSSVGSSVIGIAAYFASRRSQRREISFTREYASKEELLHLVKDLQRVENAIEKLRDEMKSELAALHAEFKAETAKLRDEQKADRAVIMSASDERIDKVVTRVDRLLEGVSRLQGPTSSS